MVSGHGGYPEMAGVKKALVIIFKNIGDVVLSSPVFSTLARGVPGVTVDALVNSGTEDVLAGNPHIRRLMVLDRGARKRGVGARIAEERRVLREVRSGGYDMVVALSHGERTLRYALFSGAPLRVGVKSGKQKFLGLFPYLTIPVTLAPANRHYVERNLDCLRRIGIFPDGESRRTEFHEGEEARGKVERLLIDGGIGDGDGFIVVHPTSRWMFKCWTPEKVAGLADRVRNELSLPVVLTSGPDAVEKGYMDRVRAGLTTEVVDLSGTLGLRELGALLRRASLFFGVDSAPMHIAAAVDTPVVAIFGPTIAADWSPWGRGHRVITSPDHACVPCGIDGCGGSKVSDCITELDISTVFGAIRDRLREYDRSG